MKKEEGITLIALVVTIIVLIILAGVSINLVLGENGIITMAKRAKENIEIAVNEEEQKLANLEVTIQLENNNIEYNLPYEGKGYKFIYDGSLKSAGINGENMQNDLTGGWSNARTSVSWDNGKNYYWYLRIFIY